jgi:hypothetical protein
MKLNISSHIYLVFKKICKKRNIKENLLEMNLDKLGYDYWHNKKIQQIVSDLTHEPIDKVITSLTDINFIKFFLSEFLINKLNCHILFNDTNKIKKYIDYYGYYYDDDSIIIAIINNYESVFLDSIESYNSNTDMTKFLNCCIKTGNDKFYFILKEKKNKITYLTLDYAFSYSSIQIIRDLSDNIAISKKSITNAFVSNNNDIINYVLELQDAEEIDIDKNLFNYPILNANVLLIDHLKNNYPKYVHFDVNIMYSAILSASIFIVQLVASNLPQITTHKCWLDVAHNNSVTNFLLDDMTYMIDNVRYYSHTINYCVQSDNLEIFDFFYNLGYQITLSNFITCIKQGSTIMLQKLCQCYTHNKNICLPIYFILYFGYNSYLSDKKEKLKILIRYGLIDLDSYINFLKKKTSVNFLKSIRCHIDIIEHAKEFTIENVYDDVDFCLSYHTLIYATDKYAIKDYLYSIIFKLAILLPNKAIIKQMLNIAESNKYIVYIAAIHNIYCDIFPKIEILLELQAYGRDIQYQQLLSPHHPRIISAINNIDEVMPILYSVCVSLDLKKKVHNRDLNFRQSIINSRKVDRIASNITNYDCLSKSEIKKILRLENKHLIKRLIINDADVDELKEWATNKKYLKAAFMLTNIVSSSAPARN